jgi:hypothetical protein
VASRAAASRVLLVRGTRVEGPTATSGAGLGAGTGFARAVTGLAIARFIAGQFAAPAPFAPTHLNGTTFESKVPDSEP